MANSEHLAKLQEGVEAWNSWKEKNGSITPELQKASLAGAQLTGAHLQMANLEGADLYNANLAKAYLSSANLKKVDLNGVNLERAALHEVNLKGAYLDYANLEGAILYGAHLEGARLYSANLSKADLQECTGLQFDDTNILHARLTPRPGNVFNRALNPFFIYNPVTDPWSELRRAYTGPNFLLTLLAFIAFLLPYVIQIGTWRSVNLAQELTRQTLSDLHTEYAARAAQGTLPPSTALAFESALANFERYDTCLAESCTHYRIWQLLVGLNKGWPFVVLALAILLYNAVRYHLTQTIAAFREEEERSGYTPSLRAYFTANLFGFHRSSKIDETSPAWVRGLVSVFPNQKNALAWIDKLTFVIGLSPTRLHALLRILFLFATAAFVVNLLEVLFTVVKLRP